MQTPFRKKVNETYIQSATTQRRWKKTLNFLESASPAKSGLEIGERTPLTAKMEDLFGCSFENTNIDLDIGSIENRYDVVTAFEVIEHLFNPLHCMLEIRKALNPNGRLYLSTPMSKPNFLWSPEHFHEMSEKSLIELFKRAEFKVVRKLAIRIHGFGFYFSGVRPMLRGFFDKRWVFELASVDQV